jgi:hypothetical protein
MLGYCEGVCISDTMVCALVRGSPRDIRGIVESKAIDFYALSWDVPRKPA